jgi:hypothetical protein
MWHGRSGSCGELACGEGCSLEGVDASIGGKTAESVRVGSSTITGNNSEKKLSCQ